jgi:ABC-type branched-subunit amino acid transport system ATPase component
MMDDTRSPQAVAELQGVHKRYGQVDALQGVDLEIQPGELLVLLSLPARGKEQAPVRAGVVETEAARVDGQGP